MGQIDWTSGTAALIQCMLELVGIMLNGTPKSPKVSMSVSDFLKSKMTLPDQKPLLGMLAYSYGMLTFLKIYLTEPNFALHVPQCC